MTLEILIASFEHQSSKRPFFRIGDSAAYARQLLIDARVTGSIVPSAEPNFKDTVKILFDVGADFPILIWKLYQSYIKSNSVWPPKKQFRAQSNKIDCSAARFLLAKVDFQIHNRI